MNRRTVLCGGCAAFVAGCGDPPGTTPSPTGDTGADPTSPAPSITDPLDNPDYPCNQPIEPGGEGWTAFPLANHPELREVGGWVANSTPGGTQYLVAHVIDGCYIAAERRCTHEGVIMEYNPSRGQLVCPRHASLFDWQGQVVGGPAPIPIRVFFAGIDGDTVWVKVTDA